MISLAVALRCVVRLQVDEEAAGVQRDVRAVDADEGGQALDVRIGEDGFRQRLLMVGHLVERNRLRRLGHALDDAGVLNGKEPLRDRHVEVAGEQERAERDQKHDALMIEHDAERRGVEPGQRLEEPPAARFAAAAMRTQELGAQHRHQGQRHDGGNDDGGGERDRKLMEQPPDDVAHEEKRDQDRDQRHGERNDGEADLRRPLHRRVVGAVAVLEKAGDVLDHHDRVVDHEAGGDGQRHQRQIVEAEAGLVHDRQRPDQRQRHRQARDDRRRDVAQEQEDDHHDKADRERKLELDVLDRGADGDRAVGQRRDRDRRRQRLTERGQYLLDAVDDLDDVRAGLALNVDDERRRGVHPRLEAAVLRRDFDPRDVGKPDRRVIAVGDDRRSRNRSDRGSDRWR